MYVSRSELLARQAHGLLVDAEVEAAFVERLYKACEYDEEGTSIEARAHTYAVHSLFFRDRAKELFVSSTEDGFELLGFALLCKLHLIMAQTLDTCIRVESDYLMEEPIKNLGRQARQQIEQIEPECKDIVQQIEFLADYSEEQRRQAWRSEFTRRAQRLLPTAHRAQALASELNC